MCHKCNMARIILLTHLLSFDYDGALRGDLKKWSFWLVRTTNRFDRTKTSCQKTNSFCFCFHSIQKPRNTCKNTHTHTKTCLFCPYLEVANDRLLSCLSGQTINNFGGIIGKMLNFLAKINSPSKNWKFYHNCRGLGGPRLSGAHHPKLHTTFLTLPPN